MTLVEAGLVVGIVGLTISGIAATLKQSAEQNAAQSRGRAPIAAQATLPSPAPGLAPVPATGYSTVDAE